MTNLLTSWHIFDFMTNIWHIYILSSCHVLMNFLTSWQIWHHDVNKFVDVMTWVWGHSKFVNSMTCFWLHNTAVWSMLHLLTSWRTFWCHGSFDDMTQFLCPDARRHVFFILWQTPLFVIISGTKYNVNAISILWRIFWCYDMLWCHDKMFDVMTCFWLHDKRFDVVAYFLL